MDAACPVVLALAEDALICGLIEDVLSPQEFTVEITVEPEAALARVETGTVSLIILDLGWAEARGLEICGRLRAAPYGARTPIIALTESSPAQRDVTGFSVGPQEYLYKPFHIDDLLAAVARYCGKR
ncbi:MAG TPA: response regulator [Chloroflexota bacterium]|jgi:DNA-binding response OmpR family regulator